eukprot:GHVR01105344.1.p1 GENE.GHVR01105344.1~~GHVR01105344.1.p1  ORF type:complete len:187 (+),score=20.73 GHVR01105344.1:666-1226(+)
MRIIIINLAYHVDVFRVFEREFTDTARTAMYENAVRGVTPNINDIRYVRQELQYYLGQYGNDNLTFPMNNNSVTLAISALAVFDEVELTNIVQTTNGTPTTVRNTHIHAHVVPVGNELARTAIDGNAGQAITTRQPHAPLGEAQVDSRGEFEADVIVSERQHQRGVGTMSTVCVFVCVYVYFRDNV